MFTYLASFFFPPQAELCQPWVRCPLSYRREHCSSCGGLSVSTWVYWLLLWSKFAVIYPPGLLCPFNIAFNKLFWKEFCFSINNCTNDNVVLKEETWMFANVMALKRVLLTECHREIMFLFEICYLVLAEDLMFSLMFIPYLIDW